MFRLMVGLHKHPKTGVYYFRKGIPKKLRPAFGGRHEYLVSLHTKDLAEANRKITPVAADFEERLARARGEAVHLSHQQVVALVGRWYSREMAQWESDPGVAVGWEDELDHLRVHDVEASYERAVSADLDDLLAYETLQVDAETRAELAKELFWGKVKRTQTLLRRSRGDYGPDDNLTKFPEWKPKGDTEQRPALTLTEMIDGWATEGGALERTKYQWTRILKSLEVLVGHDDAAKISREDIIKWKDVMIAQGLEASTVKNKLTVASTLFKWAKENERLKANPAERIRLYAKKDRTKKRQPYSTKEAKLILESAREETRAERRWVPWLLAFTGARLGEVCDATARDIRKVGKIWCLDINEENRGRPIKNQDSIRIVPLHQAIIDEGFLAYVDALPTDSPLFPDVPPDRFGQRAGTGTKRISRWIRGLGLTDVRKDPNHAWRHYVTDQLRNAGVPKDMRDRIIGHRLPDIAERYGGENLVPVLAKYIESMKSPLEHTLDEAA